MNELSFLIVNSNLPHARAEMQLLQKRVSFEVLQETEDDPVWSILGGGKDDMYIYDRCGRLTYYIPFPLSIMNDDQKLVSSAIMATYFMKPCGTSCSNNATSLFDALLEEKVDQMPENKDPAPDNEIANVDKMDVAKDIESTNTSNKTLSNEILIVTNGDEKSENSSYTDSSEDFDIPMFNFTDYDTNNDTDDTKTPDFLNGLLDMFFNFDNINASKSEENIFNELEINSTQAAIDIFNTTENYTDDSTNSTILPFQNNELIYHHNETSNQIDTVTAVTEAPIEKKSDRCAEANVDVCKSWSKKKLLRAQKCCSNMSHAYQTSEGKPCKNFGKRRCKKIKSLLKCCIKTSFTDTKEETTTEESTITAITTESVSTDSKELQCCKTTDQDKVCRVSVVGSCEEDEFLEESSSPTK